MRKSLKCLKLFFFFFFFFGREETGEMDLKRIEQIGRKYLSSALVSEKGIFQSATPQCCGKNNSWLPWKLSGKVGQNCCCCRHYPGLPIEWAAPK
uniref:Secreted protein n=1 Tax=Mus musculus TaxID=10090 RepID=Q3TB91_MOUSE|nr:unnamed protein product [Mus musculus]